jgi:hypothetical protein
VGFAGQTDRSNVQMLMVPGDFNGSGHQDVSYWLPNQRRIQQMMAQYFDQGYSETVDVDREYLRVSIQDSTGDSDAVEALINTLREAGYQNVKIDDAWREPLRVTRIVAQQGDDEGASTVRESLGFGEVRVESTGSLNSDVTIQLGRDWLKKQASSKRGFLGF